MSPNDESSDHEGKVEASVQPPFPQQEPDMPASHAQAESGGAANGPAAQPPQRRAGVPPNEFTFGWSDVGAVEEMPFAGRRKSEQLRRVNGSALPGSHPALPGLAQQLADQAARTPDRVGAAGLVAAAACLAAESATGPGKRLRRAQPHIVRAAAWIAWRLHPHPVRRNLLAMIPDSVSRCAEAVCARAGQDRPLQTGWVAALLFRQAQQVAAERAAQNAQEALSPPGRQPARNGAIRTGQFADSASAEW